MNALYKLYCRCFQRVMYVAEYFLPWRVPEQISGEGSLAKLPAFAKAKGFKSCFCGQSDCRGDGVFYVLRESEK